MVSIQAGDSVPQDSIPAAARLQPGVPLNPDAATRAYLATVPADLRARSDAYTEGGYWIQVWGVLLTSGILLLLLGTGISRRIRDWAERRTGRRPVQTWLYYLVYTLVVFAVGFPWSVYTGFVREHAYRLATQGFGGWLRDQLVGLGVSLVLGGFALTVIYEVLRRFPRAWPALGAAVSMAFIVIGTLIAPIYIAPLFNTYTILNDARIRDPILAMAHANGVAADRVYLVDASRQSTRISANVSGLLGTERITLNDNLLRRATLPEIEAVMGHETGHYVLHHIYQFLVFFTLVIAGGFLSLRSVFAWVIRGRGQRWGVRGIDDPAGMPLLELLFTVYLFVLGPVLNSYTRETEAAADIFGLNAARQPDGFAQVALKLAEYRKLDPGPLEELVWFDHPSGRARIRMAMQWKAVEGRR
jgi:STE24 endopeptidase